MRVLIKLFRIFLWLVCLILLMLGIAYGALSLIFSESRVIKMLKDGCRGYTQRECRLEHFRWSIFSGIRVSGFALSEPVDFSYGEFISCKDLRFTLDLPSLFYRRVRVGDLSVRSPKVNVSRADNGQWNFVDLASIPMHHAPIGPYASTVTPAVLMLSRVSIADGEVNYQDRTGCELLQVSGLNITAADVSILRPFNVHLSFTLHRAGREYLCAGIVEIDLQGKMLAVDRVTVDKGSDRMELSGTVAHLGDAANTAFDLHLTGSSKVIESFTGASPWSPVIRFFQGDTADVAITGTPGKIKVAFNRGVEKRRKKM